MFKIGDRVIYVSGRYVSTPYNPLQGTVYFCEGTIINDKFFNPLNLEVKWDNGQENTYRDSDLQKVRVPVPVYLDEGLFEL